LLITTVGIDDGLLFPVAWFWQVAKWAMPRPSVPADDIDAYEHFLRSRERSFHFSREDNTVARNFYSKAIQLDPRSARAYAMLALTYRQEVINGWSEDRWKCFSSS
jgi:hypothetical protein